MHERKLDTPQGYDPVTQRRVASFAAQLDDQLRRLRQDVADLEVRHLEWQPHAGVNTVGMLLAHLAIVDLWWLVLTPQDPPHEEPDAIVRPIIGIDMADDGIPLAPDGGHPLALRGKTTVDYFAMLDAARAASHAVLRTWRDEDLDGFIARGERRYTREWIAYHVLEHFAGHYGQILLLRHWMRDVGLLTGTNER